MELVRILSQCLFKTVHNDQLRKFNLSIISVKAVKTRRAADL